MLGSLDDAGDRWASSLRGRRWADAAAAVVSNLSDHGILWVLAAAWMARRPGPPRRRAVVALALSGVASYVVNRAIKRLAGRSRPERTASLHGGLPVRRPSSSSFPSGHTLASFCAATTLPVGRAWRLAALGFAAGVAASRVHLRAHHLSDVLGGATIGAALGALVRPLADLLSTAAGGSCRRRDRQE
ncbi:MAG: phosphatase PAP2 family protein [Actinomycetota bacterium]|nr:phosphatase PAP2 family protein [Actinomycetota bacterium]